ncbi:MAG: hypothetical protein J6Y03_02500 [Alphaproteobacteria bacterium]|nr:hypothetical protein [Alphaproteobacteria bacterium]
MQKTNEDLEHRFFLENGLEIRYQHADIFWGGVYAKMPFEEGSSFFLNYAANHLIEHCIQTDFSNRKETRFNMVRYDLKENLDTNEILDSFNLIADNFSHINLRNIETQKKRIFQELAGFSEKIDKFKYIGGAFLPVSITEWDRIDENMTEEKAFHFLNRQADYVADFSEEELKKHALATYGAENLILYIKAPISFEELKKLVESSKLASIPKKHKDGQLIPFRTLPDKTHYQSIKLDHLNFTIRKNKRIPEGCHSLFREVCRDLCFDKDLALYYCDLENRGNEEKWKLTITSDKAGMLRKTLLRTLANLGKNDAFKSTSIEVIRQIKGQLFQKRRQEAKRQQLKRSNPER